MKILFTGHRGFLGQELIPLLSEEVQVEIYPNDLLDQENIKKFCELNKITHIIHAAVRGGRRTKTDTHEVLVNNVYINSNIFRVGLPVLSFCSGKIYNYEYPIENAIEGQFPNGLPSDYYGQSKFLTFEMAKTNPNVTFLRFFNVFGQLESADRFIKSNAIRALKSKSLLVHKNIIMDFFFVQDTVPVLFDWLNCRLKYREINLVYSKKTDLLSIATLISNIFNSNSEIVVENHSNVNNYYGNGSRLEESLYPLIGLEEGIERAFKDIQISNNI